MEMADISLDGDGQEIAVGPSNAVESVPAVPAQVEIINGVKRHVMGSIIWYSIAKAIKVTNEILCYRRCYYNLVQNYVHLINPLDCY